MPVPNPLQDIVKDTVQLVGRRRLGNSRFLGQSSRKLFPLHVRQIINPPARERPEHDAAITQVCFVFSIV
jgi:hypothetical protein